MEEHNAKPGSSGSTVSPAPAPQNNLLDLPDVALVERAKRGEMRAFEALMRRHNRRLYRIARSILKDDDVAEDAVQEAYIQAFSNLDRYEPTGRFAAWLGRVAVNEALMVRRGVARDTVSFDELDDAALLACEASDAEPSISARYVEGLQARQLLESAIDALPERFRIVFVLRRVEQLSVSETASLLGLKDCTVRTRLHRAQRLLRTHLSRRLSREKLSVFDFGGERCDRIVAGVCGRLRLTIRMEQSS